MGLLTSTRVGCAVLAAGLLGSVCQAASWFPLGPYGGDARSLAADPADPKHLFLGTATGWVYDSHDGGGSWTRVAQVANRNDLAIDHIVVDRTNPKRLVIGAFVVDHPSDGGLYISEDYGKNWYSQAEMRGQSVRALTRSDSNPNELVAGTLKGVFRSIDNGVHWQQISPEGSTEIHEIQSIAIDPADPNVIYAGTWHLPWKTTDGGVTWHNIKEGVIDDSDVFSIIVDPKDPKVVYASACSGIYKSSDAGEMFRKVQGIPSAARRTRTLEQDPEHLETVFAGTTEGLYRTTDAGAQWDRLTPADVIVNDVYVDPTNSQHVLLATDRGGVYRSEDGGTTFETSNSGFSTRQVTAFASDPSHPEKLYVGVVNGKNTGGVFTSDDGAVHWQQQSDGLGGRDIFSLVSLEDGTLIAGTEHGIFRLTDGAWKDSSVLEGTPEVEKVAAPSTHPVKSGPKLTPADYVKRPGKTKSSQGRSGGRANLRLKSQRPSYATRTNSSRSRAVQAHSHAKSAGHGAHLLQVSAVQHAPKPAVPESGRPLAHAPARLPRSGRISAEVYTLLRSKDTLYAASSAGLLRSADGGGHWAQVSSLSLPDVHFLATQPVTVTPGAGTIAAPAVTASDSVPTPAVPGSSDAFVQDSSAGSSTVLAGGLTGVMLSSDGGANWSPVTLPHGLTQVGAIAIDGKNRMWVGGREGVWFSADSGATWNTLRNLFLTEVDSIFYDVRGQRVLVTGADSSNAFSVQLPDDKVTYSDTGWKLRFVRPVGDHLVGATLFDGMVVQPQMVDSPLGTSPATK